jgi:hypothetical protein
VAREADAAPNVPEPHDVETRDRKAELKTGFFSLRARLLALLAFVLIPWLGLLLYTQSDERRAAIANVNRDALRLIHVVTSNQAAEIEAARQLLTSFAALPQLRSANSDACSALLGEMLQAMPMYFNFGVAELDGNLGCSALPLRSRSMWRIERTFKACLRRAASRSAITSSGGSRSSLRSPMHTRCWVPQATSTPWCLERRA